jgi:RNA polymerase sigma factor (sigma-70 family)
VRYPNPFAETPAGDTEDRALVREAQAGSREALEQLVRRHQPWIYNIALRMAYWPADAEDTTQEILIKLITKLSTFQGKSSFRTWLYRIVVNHLLNDRRRAGRREWTFDDYGRAVEGTPDRDLPDDRSAPADVRMMVDEATIACTSGMLLCFSREQRLVYILGEIFGVTDAVGAELLDVSRDNFRQQLARARRDLHSFMQGKCGLVNEANPCRCAKKTLGFVEAGYLVPGKLLFARERVTRVREVAEHKRNDLAALDEAYAGIHREHPFQEPPDFVASLRELIHRADFRSIVEFE